MMIVQWFFFKCFSFNNKTKQNQNQKVNLECRPKSMLMSMNFSEPFRGVVSVGKSTFGTYEQNQECALRGDGRRTYSLQIFHNRCLTRFDVSFSSFLFLFVCLYLSNILSFFLL